MRILHICQRDDPDTGGSLRVAEALVREQRKAGVDAWLLFLYGELGEVARALSEGVVTLGLHSSREAMGGVGLLKKIIRRIHPDIIHSHDGILWPRLVFISFRTPVVMHSHLPLSTTNTMKDRLGRILVRLTTQSLIGISLHTIGTWVDKKYPASKIHYIPNGVDFDRFSTGAGKSKPALREALELPADKTIILWVGRVHREMKGSDRVMRVARLLPDNCCLVVVGNGPDYEGMRQACNDLIEAGTMKMVGSISRPEDYYRTADAFLFTSYHEPFGLVILEAVASGLPIIAFPVTQGGGAVKLLEEFNAVTVEADPQITAALQSVGDRTGEAEANLRAAKENYSWRAVTARVNEVYEMVLNKVIG